MTDPKQVRCTDCAVTFDYAKLVGTTCCPNCGSTSVPCDPAKDVTVKLNWHELRILCIWAENYGRSIGTPGTVYSIAGRLEEQARAKDFPALTLAGELGEIPGAKLFDKNGEVPL